MKDLKFKTVKKLIEHAIDQYKLKSFKEWPPNGRYRDSYSNYEMITYNDVRINFKDDICLVHSPDAESLVFHDEEAKELYFMVEIRYRNKDIKYKPIEAKLEELLKL